MKKIFQLTAALCLVGFGPLALAENKAPTMTFDYEGPYDSFSAVKVVYGTFPGVNEYFKDVDKVLDLIQWQLVRIGLASLNDPPRSNLQVRCHSMSRFKRADQEVGTNAEGRKETTTLGFDIVLEVHCGGKKADLAKVSKKQLRKLAEAAIRDNIKVLQEDGIRFSPNWDTYKKPRFGGGVTGSN